MYIPVSVTNGNYGLKDPKVYPYSPDTWKAVDKKGDCWFDESGLLQIIKDVQHQYNGSDKFFISGFEAGAHLTWTMIFHHPEMLLGAAPVAGNFQGRCVDESSISKASSRVNLPIKAFYGQDDQLFGLGGTLYKQWLQAKDMAIKHGYNAINETSIPLKAHVPMPVEVLQWFYTVFSERSK